MAINQEVIKHAFVVTANVFIKKDGQYLMIKRSPLKSVMPDAVHPFGGKIDPDENPYLAAQREVLEETGLKVTNMRLEAVVLELKPLKHAPDNWLVFHFSADYESGELMVSEEGEPIWLLPKEIINQKLFPSVQQIIGHIIDPKEGTVFATFEYDDQGTIIEETKKIAVCAV